MQTSIIPYLYQERILQAKQENTKGIIVAGTGAGKSNVMGWSIKERILAGDSVIVVVAPRILLAQQLFETIDERVGNKIVFQHRFVYSNTDKIIREEQELASEYIIDVNFPTTSVHDIQEEKERADRNKVPLILMTTYHSLERVIESGIPIDTAYLDEVHNAVSLEFNKSVKQLSQVAERMYSYTATPKKTDSAKGRGNNNEEVYGKIICEVTAKELIEAGAIVPPEINYLYSHINASDVDDVALTRDIIKQTFEHYEKYHSHLNHKILFACNGTETIHQLHTETDLIKWAQQNNIDTFITTSNYGDWVNGVRIKSRSKFLKMLRECGSDPNRKMAVLHYSILSEGIDVPGLTGCVLLRDMNPITLTQTIGRVLRMLPVDRRAISEGLVKAGDTNSYAKGYGLVTVPIHKDSSDDLNALVSKLYNALCGMGFPPEVIMHEEDTRGKKEITLPDDFLQTIKQKTKEVAADWEWVYKKEEFFGDDVDAWLAK